MNVRESVARVWQILQLFFYLDTSSSSCFFFLLHPLLVRFSEGTYEGGWSALPIRSKKASP